MNIFLEDHRKLIEDMLLHGVEFILIGGYAVNYHGYNRTTGDLDVWLKPNNANKKNILKCLKEYDIEDASLQQIDQLDFTHALVFSIGEPPYKTDFLTKCREWVTRKLTKERSFLITKGWQCHLSISII